MAKEELKYAHYELCRRPDGSLWELGRGAMGVTYKARDPRLRVDVALKVINQARIGDPTAQALFLREARAAARVHQSNVAGVAYLNEDASNPFYAMEFVAGVALRDWLHERAPLPPVLAIGLAVQIAHGLGAIHAENVVHRDLKPANLMIVRTAAGRESGAAESDPANWQAKIIDFGLARSFAGDLLTSRAEALTSGFRGTAVYASPEQCEERKDIDGRADFYSLGCILWEMLLGTPPFQGRSLHQLLTLHVSCPPPVERLAHLPECLQTAVARLLAKDPEARYPNATAVVNALEHCRQRIEGGAERLAGSEPAPELETTLAPASPTSVPGASRSSRAGLLPGIAGVFKIVSAVVNRGWWQQSTPIVEKSPPGASTTDPNSIAVLAFANVSDDKENEYFSDGISEELLTVLQKNTWTARGGTDLRIFLQGKKFESAGNRAGTRCGTFGRGQRAQVR